MYGLMTQKFTANRLDISVDFRHAQLVFDALIANWNGLKETRFFWNDEATVLRVVAENNDVLKVCDILESASRNF